MAAVINQNYVRDHRSREIYCWQTADSAHRRRADLSLTQNIKVPRQIKSELACLRPNFEIPYIQSRNELSKS